MKRFIVAIAGFASIGLSQNAAAQATATASMEVSAIISTVCTVTALPLVFGEVSAQAPTTSTASVTATCTGGGSYTIGLGNGLHALSGQRRLRSGSNLLAYDIYKENTYTDRWGSSGAELQSETGTALPQIFTAYGRIPADQALKSGNGIAFTDTVTVTITY